jgi:H+-translocating NAD(P) transhydrogenase subunit beta
MSEGAVQLVYLVSIALFAIGFKRLSRIRTSRSGNALAGTGMLLAVIGALVEAGTLDLVWVAVGLAVGSAVGVYIVLTARATAMPEIVARFNGFGGGASALVAIALFWREIVEAGADTVAVAVLGVTSAVTLVLSVLIGASTFSGSVVAELKLRGTLSGMPRIPARWALMGLLAVGGLAAGGLATFLTADPELGAWLVIGLLALSLVIGVVLVVPIGGADMPVVISLLNSLSGVAAAATGFALGHNLLIIAGTLVGAAGLILTQIMCAAMNRSLMNVIAGGYGADGGGETEEDYQNILSADAEEAVMVLEAARSVAIVPGYGLAAARAQHAAAELADALEVRGVDVKFGIHPVAGRMPGHMNVVLAEADVSYDKLLEMDEINRDFNRTDVVLVVGANDVVNPAARQTSGNPISGMPILNVDEAGRVFVIKRSLSPGYAGMKNELFEAENTVMLFGDARDVLHQLIGELEAAVPVD